MTDDQCKNIATVRRYWPGSEPDLVCVRHAEDSRRIAMAMGFSLHLDPIGYPAGAAFIMDLPTCCCSAGFSQTVEWGDESPSITGVKYEITQ